MNRGLIGKKRTLFQWMPALFFLLYFIIGLCVFSSYGISVDEEVQRQHSLVAYKYINKKLFHREIPCLADVPELPDYDVKFYGTAAQMPVVLVEDMAGFCLQKKVIYLMRHLYNFLICFCGYVCFYFFLKKVFSDQKMAFIGMALISLYPRFFGNQFFDLKNLVFAAFSMAVLLALAGVVEKYSLRNLAVFAAAAGIATNQRMMGILYPAVLMGYFFVEKKLSGIGEFIVLIKKCILLAVLYFGTWFLVTPAAWTDPAGAFKMAFIKFSKFDLWNGTMVFQGRLLTCEERPWYYLFVWFGISIPVFYIVLFIAGNIGTILLICRSRNRWGDMTGKYKWPVCFMMLFWTAVGAVIGLNSRIYVEWRHMYFVFVPFCCIAVYGYYYLLQVINHKIVHGTVIACLLVQVLWMFMNHPYQYVYFNIIGRTVAEQYDRDSWRVSNADLLNWILENRDENGSQVITIQGGSALSVYMLEREEAERFAYVNENPEYIIENFRNVAGNTAVHEGYEEVHTIWVDNFKIASVYQRNSDVHY